MPRAHWKGYLKLSLVSCPIALYPASSAVERVSFRQVNRQTINRLKQQMVDAVTGEVVQPYDKGRGYEVGEQQLLLVEDEDLAAAQEESRRRPYNAPPTPRLAPTTEQPPASQGAPPSRDNSRRFEPMRGEAGGPAGRRGQGPTLETPPPAPARPQNNCTIEIERFFPAAQIDARYLDAPYYLAPRDEVGQEAFAVIRDAMGGKEMVGMGRVVLQKRERPIMIRPLGKGLCGITLRYSHEVRGEAEFFAGIPDLTLPEEMLELAEHILETKTAAFDPAFLEDRYRTVLVSMLKAKQAELPTKAAAKSPSQRNVINLMDALKRSLETERKSAVRTPTRRPSRLAKSPPGRKPQPGKGG